MHKHALSTWFRARLRHLSLYACTLCGTAQDNLMCNGCTGDLTSYLHRRRCIQCAIVLDTRHATRHYHTCLADAPDFDAAVAITDYAWSLGHLVTGLGFRAQLPLADWLATQLGSALTAAPDDLPDMLLPVPLLPARLHSRDYNQAWEVARRIARRLNTPAHAGTLQRVRNNITQATPGRARRLTNLHGAFVVAEPTRIAGRYIEVISNVMTTDTTFGETAARLKRADATRVTDVVALRTP